MLQRLRLQASAFWRWQSPAKYIYPGRIRFGAFKTIEHYLYFKPKKNCSPARGLFFELPKSVTSSQALLSTMELGFTVAAGPLSQISVSLFSVELAVQLATGAYGWWKVRDRGRSLAGLVESKGAQISATSTFNLLRYVPRRQDSLLRGVARSPDGILSCVTLPNASTASTGDAGMVCLRAVVCGLLCFYTTPTVLEILVGALPGTLYISDQEGGNESIEGPLLSCLREYVKAAAVEEDSDQLRQRLQDTVDSKLLNITRATHADVFECDEFLESDVPNFIGALRWILTPELKRKQRVYPTRSLKVWALTVVMAQLGFEVVAAMHAISSKKDYEVYIENVGYQPTYQEVFLVTFNDVPTDPLTVGGRVSPAPPKPRIGSIRSIPRIAFRHLNNRNSLVNTEFLSGVWEFTFKYVLNLLEPPPKMEYRPGLSVELLFTRAALDSFGEKSSYKSINPRSSDRLHWLTLVITKPLQKFLPSDSDMENIWILTNSVGQFHGLPEEYLDLPKGKDADNWYIARVVVLATIYALCCRWLYPDDSMVDPLDTEVAFCPDFIRRGNLAVWTLFSGFHSMIFTERVPSSFKGDWRFASSMSHRDWFYLLYLVFSGSPNSHEIKNRLSYESQSPKNLGTTILGFQKNGIVMLPDLLVHPSANPEVWFQYHLRVGQILDLPLDQDGFICHSNRPENHKSEPGSSGVITDMVENVPSDRMIRLDAEPWWEFDERSVVFRARVDGVVKAIFSPEAIYKKSTFYKDPTCQCPTPNTSMVRLKKPAVVYRVSEYLSKYRHEHTKSVFVQTGGDRTAQIVCLALSPSGACWSTNGCLDCFAGDYVSDFNVL